MMSVFILEMCLKQRHTHIKQKTCYKKSLSYYLLLGGGGERQEMSEVHRTFGVPVIQRMSLEFTTTTTTTHVCGSLVEFSRVCVRKWEFPVKTRTGFKARQEHNSNLKSILRKWPRTSTKAAWVKLESFSNKKCRIYHTLSFPQSQNGSETESYGRSSCSCQEAQKWACSGRRWHGCDDYGLYALMYLPIYFCLGQWFSFFVIVLM